jgi:hypothetical protein
LRSGWTMRCRRTIACDCWTKCWGSSIGRRGRRSITSGWAIGDSSAGAGRRTAVWSRERQRPEPNRPTLHQRATPSAIVATPIDVTPRGPRRHSAGRSRQRALPVATAFWTVVKWILAKSCIAFGPFFRVSFGCKPLIIKNLRHSPPLRGPQNNSFYFRVVLNQIDYSSLPHKLPPYLARIPSFSSRHFPPFPTPPRSTCAASPFLLPPNCQTLPHDHHSHDTLFSQVLT